MTSEYKPVSVRHSRIDTSNSCSALYTVVCVEIHYPLFKAKFPSWIGSLSTLKKKKQEQGIYSVHPGSESYTMQSGLDMYIVHLMSMKNNIYNRMRQ